MASNDFLLHNLTVGADNQFTLANEIVAEPKSLGDVMNNLAIRIINEVQQQIDNEGLEHSAYLRQTVSMPIDLFGQTFTATLYMADYYDFINKGVRGVGGERQTENGRKIPEDEPKPQWEIKAPSSPYFYKDKKPPVEALRQWADEHGMNVFALREVIYHSGIRPRKYFDRAMESINNGEIKRRFVQELNKAGGEAIVKGMKELITRQWQ